MSLFNYPKHNHPHGVDDMLPEADRIWVCEECACILADSEARDKSEWGHQCKRNPKRPCRCESHLEPYYPELFMVRAPNDNLK